jgi:hypothetical protein
MDIPSPLLTRLQLCAQLWAETNALSLARLGRDVVNDGGFFTRIQTPGASTTTATLERFAVFLSDCATWPEGVVPPAVSEFARIVGVHPASVAAAEAQDHAA